MLTQNYVKVFDYWEDDGESNYDLSGKVMIFRKDIKDSKDDENKYIEFINHHVDSYCKKYKLRYKYNEGVIDIYMMANNFKIIRNTLNLFYKIVKVKLHYKLDLLTEMGRIEPKVLEEQKVKVWMVYDSYLDNNINKDFFENKILPYISEIKQIIEKNRQGLI